MAGNATLTIKVGANVKDAAQQLQALGYNVETVKKKTDKANESASLWSQTLKKGSEDSIKKLVEMGAKFLTLSTVVSGVYKGISSCVSEALKEDQSAAKKIEQINEAWTNVKKNLGGALLDSITPALESLYDMLLKLEEWTKKFATSANQSTFISSAAKSLNKTGTFDSSDYTLVELESFRDNISVMVSDTSKLNNEQKAHLESYKRILTYLESEISARYETISSSETLTTSTEELTTAITAVTSAVSSGGLKALLGGYSDLYNQDTQVAGLRATLANLKGAKMTASGTELLYITDAISNVQKQIDALVGATEEATTAVEEATTAVDNFHQTNTTTLADILGGNSASYNNYQQKSSLLGTLANLKGAKMTASEEDLPYITEAIESVQSQIDALDASLDESKESWQDYWSEVSSYGLNAFDSLMTYQNQYYTNEMNAIRNSEASEEEKNAKLNELGKRQFEAQQMNSYANATISYAEGLINIWSKYSEMPWMAGILTALLTANTGAQFATISSQSYTGFAEGGIVQSPTRALIGEGAEKEAVIPLSKLEDFIDRGDGGVINLSISVSGNASADDVYYAIERAQRTGLLPHWRYA